jgi:hypothetical protein
MKKFIWTLLLLASLFNQASAQILELARLSPIYANEHNFDIWRGLYSDNATIQDPVGTTPHTATGKKLNIKNFWTVFIKPNNILVESDFDYTVGDTAIRDVTITTQTPTGLEIDLSAILIYKLDKDSNKIGEMQAYWELPKLVKQVLRKKHGVKTLFKMMGAMFKHEKLAGIYSFTKGLFYKRKRKKKVFKKFLRSNKQCNIKTYDHFSAREVDCKEFKRIVRDTKIKNLIASGEYLIARFKSGKREGFFRIRFKRKTIKHIELY